MPRRFKIGQLVRYRPRSHRSGARTGRYQITSFLRKAENEEPRYRIRNLNEGDEQVAKESELHSL
jgi:hypothetical protein